MATIKPELKAQFEAEPDQSVNLIVRTEGDATPHLDWLATTNVQVTRQFRLTPGVAVTCTGQAALQLLDQQWVKSIEPDEIVTTM